MADEQREIILNVDVDEPGRYTTSHILRQAGFEVREAATGAEALELAREGPDLILLEVNLPDINGFDVCQRLKADTATRWTPVLHLSATYLDDQAKIAGLDSGAEGYLTKPIEPAVLLAYVRALLRTRRAEKDLRKSQRELDIRNKIASIFLTSPDEEMYGDVLEVVLEAMDSKYGVFGYIDENGAFVVPSMNKDIWDQCQIPDKQIVFRRETWGDSSWPRAIRQKKANYSNERSSLAPKGHVPMERYISTPIVHHEEVVGLFLMANKETVYGEGDIRLLQTIADSVAPVLAARLQRERREEEREKLIAKLETQNAELERFTYTVSHDLKSPLITFKGFIGIVRESLAARNAPAVEDGLRRMDHAADKMAELLAGLLELSRIGRVVNPPDDVPFGEIAAEAMELVWGQVNHTGVRVEMDPDMPVIHGDRFRMVEAMQNLIENAVKWTAGRPDPRIEIGVRRDGRETVCYVRDNGAGIDPQYHQRIFGLFEKLDPSSKGAGVGLALVKRIIEVQGGRVWVESEGEGHGSAFCFALPQKTDATEHEEIAKCVTSL